MMMKRTMGSLAALLLLTAGLSGCASTALGKGPAVGRDSDTVLGGLPEPALAPIAASDDVAQKPRTAVAALALPETVARGDMLPFRVVDSSFSAALNRAVFLGDDPPALHVFDPVTRETRSARLTEGGLMMSVAPNGRVAAVLQHGKIRVFDLPGATLRATHAIKPSITRIVLTNDRILGFPEERGDDFVTLELASGRQTWTNRFMQWLGRGVVAGPLQRVYAPSRGTSPGFLGRLDTNEKGDVVWKRSRSTDVKHPVCGDLWASVDGLRIFTGCGTVFRGSESPDMDLVFDGRLPLSGVQGLAQLPQRGELAVIPWANRPNRDGELAADDTQLLLFAYEGFGLLGRSALPAIAAADRHVPTHGRAVFASPDGRAFHVLVEADPEASLSRGFAWITLRRDAATAAPRATKPAPTPETAATPAAPVVAHRARTWRARDLEPLRVTHIATNDLVDLGDNRKLGKCVVSIGEPERLLRQLAHLLPPGGLSGSTVREFVTARAGARPVFAMLLADSPSRPLHESHVAVVTGVIDAERAALCVHQGHANLDDFVEESSDFLSAIEWQRNYVVRFVELHAAWYHFNRVERFRLEVRLPGVVRPHVLSQVGGMDVPVGFESVMVASQSDGNHRLIRRGIFVSPGTSLSTLRDIETIEVGDAQGVLQQASFREASPGRAENLVLEREGVATYTLHRRVGDQVIRRAFTSQGELAGPLVKDERFNEVRDKRTTFMFELNEFRPEYSTDKPTTVRYSRAATDPEGDVLIEAAGRRMIGRLSHDGRLQSLRIERSVGARLERSFVSGAARPMPPRLRSPRSKTDRRSL